MTFPSLTSSTFVLLVALLMAGCAPGTRQAPPAIQGPAATALSDATADATAASTAGTVPDDAVTSAGAEAALPTASAEQAALPTPTAAPVPAVDPAGTTFALEPLATTFDQPVFLTHAGDGTERLFVVEKAGRIQIMEDGQRGAEPFLDLTEVVNDGGNEQGLLGLAFHPDFANNGYLYVNYTDTSDATIVERYQVLANEPMQADPASAFQILRVPQPARNHNAGMLAFGPDGYLYVGLGDGGAANDQFGNGQNPAALLGKMLRLNVTSDPEVPYTIPADNPWLATDWNGTDVLDEIWLVGLRNPWRYSFDRANGDLWIADVGQNQYEEINRIPGGSVEALNLGWPIMEGQHCFPSTAACDKSGLILPVAEYDHQGGNCSVTGGYVYRGSAQPQLDGVYFFGDYCSGNIWALYEDAATGWQQTLIVEDGGQISSFGEDAAGELYVLDLSRGTITRLVATSAP